MIGSIPLSPWRRRLSCPNRALPAAGVSAFGMAAGVSGVLDTRGEPFRYEEVDIDDTPRDVSPVVMSSTALVVS